MKKMHGMFRGMAAAIAIAIGVLGVARGASAADKITLKDGRVLEGTVIREEGGYVWFKAKVGSVEQDMFFEPDKIGKLERDSTSTPVADPAKPTDKPKERVAAKSGVPRIAIISLGEKPEKEMVGIYITAKALKDTIPYLEQEGVTDVVLRINSGGGLGLEVQRLSDVIEYDIKPKFHTVAWIEWAISAAAMTAHAVPEIYFTPQGAYGACTGWFGALQAVKDRPLEEMLFEMEKISARGGYDPKIMRSMQILEPLSYTMDENGEVHFYQTEEGEVLLNPKDKILTFTAETALQCKFSKGTASTKEELARLMGYSEVEWVGLDKPGKHWPVARAEEIMQRYRDQVKMDEERTEEYFVSYQTAKATAASQQEKKDRAKFVARASQYLDKIEKMVDNNPNFALLIFGVMPEQFDEWVAEERRQLKELLK